MCSRNVVKVGDGGIASGGRMHGGRNWGHEMGSQTGQRERATKFVLERCECRGSRGTHRHGGGSRNAKARGGDEPATVAVQDGGARVRTQRSSNSGEMDGGARTGGRAARREECRWGWACPRRGWWESVCLVDGEGDGQPFWIEVEGRLGGFGGCGEVRAKSNIQVQHTQAHAHTACCSCALTPSPRLEFVVRGGGTQNEHYYRLSCSRQRVVEVVEVVVVVIELR